MDTQTKKDKFAPPVDRVSEGRKFLDKFGVSDVDEMEDKEVIELLDKIQAAKAEQIQVLARGQSTEGMQRLLAKLPRGYEGQFVADNALDISGAEALGWRIFFDEAASKESATAKSDTRVTLGDCVLMMIPIEKLIAIRVGKEDRNKARREAHRPKKQAQSSESELELPIEADLFGKSS